MSKEVKHIKVYGTTSAGHQLVVNVLKTYLDRSGVPYKLEEVTDISKFIEEGIESVPAIQYKENIMTLKDNGGFNNSLRQAVRAILKDVNFGTLPKVVIPVDFSDTSLNAFAYGHRLASEAGAVSKALHVYYPTAREINETLVIDVDFQNIRKRYLDELVAKFDVDWTSDLMKVSLLDSEFRTGFPGEEIIDSAKENDADLIIMGSTGDSSRIKKWFGSVSTKVMNESEVPVLLVPDEAKYKGVNKIVYAFDEIELDEKVIQDLTDFCEVMKAELHLVHVNTEDDDIDPGYYIEQITKHNYDQSKVSVHSIYGEDICTTLTDFAEENNVDVIAMTTTHRSFINRIFHESISKKVAFHSTIPVLIFKA